MGPLFVIAFWALLGVLATGGWFLLASLGKKSPFAKQLKKTLPAAVVSVFSVLLLAWLVAVIVNQIPSVIFSNAVGFDPPSDIQELQAETNPFFDLRETWLSFRASPRTVELILNRHSLLETSEQNFRGRYSGQHQGSDLMRLTEGGSRKFYVASGLGAQEGSANVMLIYNEEKQTVFFFSAVLQ